MDPGRLSGLKQDLQGMAKPSVATIINAGWVFPLPPADWLFSLFLPFVVSFAALQARREIDLDL